MVLCQYQTSYGSNLIHLLYLKSEKLAGDKLAKLLIFVLLVNKRKNETMYAVCFALKRLK